MVRLRGGCWGGSSLSSNDGLECESLRRGVTTWGVGGRVPSDETRHSSEPCPSSRPRERGLAGGRGRHFSAPRAWTRRGAGADKMDGGGTATAPSSSNGYRELAVDAYVGERGRAPPAVHRRRHRPSCPRPSRAALSPVIIAFYCSVRRTSSLICRVTHQRERASAPPWGHSAPAAWSPGAVWRFPPPTPLPPSPPRDALQPFCALWRMI